MCYFGRTKPISARRRKSVIAYKVLREYRRYNYRTGSWEYELCSPYQGDKFPVGVKRKMHPVKDTKFLNTVNGQARGFFAFKTSAAAEQYLDKVTYATRGAKVFRVELSGQVVEYDGGFGHHPGYRAEECTVIEVANPRDWIGR